MGHVCRVFLVALLLLGAGCQGLVGPRQRREQGVWIDDPRLSIPEQQQRKRDQLALPENSPQITPRTGAEEPSIRGAYPR
jgi:hypothetical protein